jgi:hypothetical protein
VTVSNVRLALRALGADAARGAHRDGGRHPPRRVVTGSKSLVQRRMAALGTRAVWVLTNDNPENGTGTRSRFTRLRPSDVSALKDHGRRPTRARSRRVAKTQVTVTWESTTYNPASFAATPSTRIWPCDAGDRSTSGTAGR